MTLLRKFNQAPFELKAFAVFALLTTLLSYVLPATLEKDTWEKTIKYTGWSPAMPYMFSSILVFSAIFQNNYSKHIYLKWILVVQLAIPIYSGFQRQLLVDDGSTTTNPYLMVSEYQYIWTILIPAFWILVILLSPNIKRFYEAKSQVSN